MASNLSTIGFVFSDEATFREATVRHAGEIGAYAECEPGRYGIWRSRTGAELWFHLGHSVDATTEIHGLTPFFEGQSDVAVNVTSAIKRLDDSAFEGGFHVWVVGATPSEDNCGSYPLVFDAVDFARHSNAVWPATRNVRLTAFARDIAAFESEAEYLKQRADGDEPRFNLAPKGFIPIGLFAAAMSAEAKADRDPPSPQAYFTGCVLAHSRLTNEATGAAFDWLLVETLDAIIDVVADPEVVKGSVVEGGTVEVSALLFGRFLNEITG